MSPACPPGQKSGREEGEVERYEVEEEREEVK
jgi:hypothetical protein